MNNDFHDLSVSPRPTSVIFSEVPSSSIGLVDEIDEKFRHSTRISSPRSIENYNKQFTEEYRRDLIEKDIAKAHEKGFWVCRFWQLILTLNIVIVVVTMSLVLLLLFSIGPLGKRRNVFEEEK